MASLRQVILLQTCRSWFIDAIASPRQGKQKCPRVDGAGTKRQQNREDVISLLPKIMNDLVESINYLTAHRARIDTEVLLLLLYCLKRISRKKYTPELDDLYVILEVELAKRAAQMGQ